MANKMDIHSVTYDFQQWHDYDVEYARKEGFVQGFIQGFEIESKRSLDEYLTFVRDPKKKSMIKSLIKMKYSDEVPLWINVRSLEEVSVLLKALFKNVGNVKN